MLESLPSIPMPLIRIIISYLAPDCACETTQKITLKYGDVEEEATALLMCVWPSTHLHRYYCNGFDRQQFDEENWFFCYGNFSIDMDIDGVAWSLWHTSDDTGESSTHKNVRVHM